MDLLLDRTAAPLANWLHQHPSIEIIVRDGSGAYADGARAGSPLVYHQLAWLLVRDPDGLDDGDLALLGRLQAACPPAAAADPLLQVITRII